MFHHKVFEVTINITTTTTNNSNPTNVPTKTRLRESFVNAFQYSEVKCMENF